VAFRLIPREQRFFDDFVALAEEIQRGAVLLEEMLAPERVEDTCDSLTHDIIKRLYTTFITPLDREDIHAMASSLDDVIDAIDDSSAIVRLYQIDRVRPDARALAKIISLSTVQIVSATRALGNKMTGLSQCAVEINRLENEADRAKENAVRRLFEEEKDPVAIMKWKEILDFLEIATDRCEDVANVLEGVVVKHA
jgi:uncharacterized protein